MTSITVAEAAAALGVTKQRVHALIRLGRIRRAGLRPQRRSAGRFGPGGTLLRRDDVDRVARELGRSG